MSRTTAGTAGAAALAAIVIAGAVLRLHHLDTQSLWLDEAFSITIADSTIDYILETTSEDVHPPLYYFLLYGWVHLLGATEWTGRLFSVVTSIGILLGTYALGARIEDRRVGLIAAGLLAVSPFQVEYAQELRMYALLGLAATLATYCLWRVADALGHSDAGDDGRSARQATWWTVGYAVLASMLPYVQVHGWFVLAAHACTIALEIIRRGRKAEPLVMRWTAAMLGVAVVFLAWLPIFALQVRQVQTAFWIPPPEAHDLFAPFEHFAGSQSLLWPLGLLAIAGSIIAWKWPMTRGLDGAPRPATFLLPWLICPVALPFLLSLVGSSIFLAKYTIAASVPFAVLASFGLARMSRWWQIAAAATLVAVVVSQSLAVLRPYYTTVRKDAWRDAVREIERRASPGDAVIFHPFFTQIPYDFYRTRTDLVEAPFPKHAGLVTTTTLPHVLDEVRGSHDRVWLVLMSFDARKPVLVEALARRYSTVERARAFHIDIYRGEGRRP